mmetsp:Transcript_126783/g.366983  ORF Transcript_126783/g.366983 Transcript_126783/m.366983 type:complete len:311 (+) Transcript_126783:438-1370(+)
MLRTNCLSCKVSDLLLKMASSTWELSTSTLIFLMASTTEATLDWAAQSLTALRTSELSAFIAWTLAMALSTGVKSTSARTFEGDRRISSRTGWKSTTLPSSMVRLILRTSSSNVEIFGVLCFPKSRMASRMGFKFTSERRWSSMAILIGVMALRIGERSNSPRTILSWSRTAAKSVPNLLRVIFSTRASELSCSAARRICACQACNGSWASRIACFASRSAAPISARSMDGRRSRIASMTLDRSTAGGRLSRIALMTSEKSTCGRWSRMARMTSVKSTGAGRLSRIASNTWAKSMRQLSSCRANLESNSV